MSYDFNKWWCEDHREGCLLDGGDIYDHAECRLEVFDESGRGSNNFGGRVVIRKLEQSREVGRVE